MENVVIGVGRQALITALLVGAPVLGLSLAVGLIISVFQATTQINEQTLTFVPKILAALGALAIFGPWMLSKMMGFAAGLLGNLTMYIR